jgi:hypothetical protein
VEKRGILDEDSCEVRKAEPPKTGPLGGVRPRPVEDDSFFTKLANSRREPKVDGNPE